MISIKLALLHSERPKLLGVLVVLHAVGLISTLNEKNLLLGEQILSGRVAPECVDIHLESSIIEQYIILAHADVNYI